MPVSASIVSTQAGSDFGNFGYAPFGLSASIDSTQAAVTLVTLGSSHCGYSRLDCLHLRFSDADQSRFGPFCLYVCLDRIHSKRSDFGNFSDRIWLLSTSIVSNWTAPNYFGFEPFCLCVRLARLNSSYRDVTFGLGQCVSLHTASLHSSSSDFGSNYCLCSLLSSSFELQATSVCLVRVTILIVSV